MNIKMKFYPFSDEFELEDDKNSDKKKVNRNTGRGKNSLKTGVNAGDTIIWSRHSDQSEINDILAVFPHEKNGLIFNGKAAERKGDTFIIKVPENIKEAEEKYYIVYSTKKNPEPVIIDPYIIIPPS
jgi:hypothetical protein